MSTAHSLPKRTNSLERAGILSISVNQDETCIAIGSLHGIRIFNLKQGRVLLSEDCGAIRIVEMLFCTSLLTYVGAGEQPHLSPRKLILMNTQTMSEIKTTMLHSTILAVKLNRTRLVVLLETRAIVYGLETLQKLKIIETPSNPKGVCAMSTKDCPCYLALPSSPDSGSLRLFDLLKDGGNLQIEIDAHKSPLSIMKFNENASLLATASEKGTVIYVFSIPDGERLFTLRRGSVQASILSMAFTSVEQNPRLLAVAGSHGTLHVFKLVTHHLSKTFFSQMTSAAAGMLTAATSLPFDNLVEALRSCVAIRLPVTSLQVCCFAPLSPEANNSSTGKTSDSAVLYVACSDGNLYEFSLTGLLLNVDTMARETHRYRLMGTHTCMEEPR